MIRFTVSIILISLVAEGAYAHHHTQTPQWITLESLGMNASNPPENWSPKASHELLLKELSKKSPRELFFIIRGEFYAFSAGEEFYHLCADDHVNAEYHAIADAATQLWCKLATMERLADITKAAVSKAVDAVKRSGDIERAMPALFDAIEGSIKEDATLYAEYARLKDESKKRASEAAAKPPKIYYYEIPKTNDEAAAIVASALNKPANKRHMVHAAFANETRKGAAKSAENFALARSVLELAKRPEKADAVQRNYDAAISEVADGLEDVDPKKFPRDNTLETILARLMAKLSEKFEKNAEFGADVEATKKIVAAYDN